MSIKHADWNLQNEIEFQSNNDNFSEPRSQEDSFDEEDIRNKYINIVTGLLKSINDCRNYLKKKEAVKNEKYIILFTDFFNIFKITDDEIDKKFDNLPKDKDINFLFVGKNKKKNIKNEKENSIEEDEDKKLNDILLEKFGDKSELIVYENMKKIKEILSNNNVIKDEIIYPNEIYK